METKATLSNKSNEEFVLSEFEALNQGVYFVTVNRNDKTSEHFKIIKN